MLEDLYKHAFTRRCFFDIHLIEAWRSVDEVTSELKADFRELKLLEREPHFWTELQQTIEAFKQLS